jgi:hypothetical protein
VFHKILKIPWLSEQRANSQVRPYVSVSWLVIWWLRNAVSEFAESLDEDQALPDVNHLPMNFQTELGYPNVSVSI